MTPSHTVSDRGRNKAPGPGSPMRGHGLTGADRTATCVGIRFASLQSSHWASWGGEGEKDLNSIWSRRKENRGHGQALPFCPQSPASGAVFIPATWPPGADYKWLSQHINPMRPERVIVISVSLSAKCLRRRPLSVCSLARIWRRPLRVQAAT